MDTAPRFSIITVCWNEADVIAATCDSIVSQSFQDYEWIVVDGESTDGTLEVLGAYRDRINVLVSEPDKGIYDAMNKGIRQALGEYVVFMNGGDRFADQGVLATVAAAPCKDLIYGDLRFDGEAGVIKQFPDVLPSDYLLSHMLPHQASYIRRSLFDQYGLHDESFRIAGDYEMFARLVKGHGVSTHHVARILALFGDGGVSQNPEQRMLRKQENHRIRKQYFPRYRFSLKGLKEELRSRRL